MKLLAYFIISLNIFSLCAQEDRHLKKQVLDYFVNSYVYEGDRIYLRYGGNERLKRYLIENKLMQDQDLSFHDLRQFLSEDEIYAILSEEQVGNFLKQLQKPREEIIYAIDVKNPPVGYTPVSEVKENFEIGVPLDTGIYYLRLSEPLVPVDKKQV